ncbi:type IV secretion system protein (plasmid) [Skermanella sp. TT6]|uniref:Type IV secretion system protein n=1 Tax=Skermanella cutis TaxID=2775420 RepID=A0ABX7BI34_9PROT|nr:type IV secretion system protein [Skermanella sp. TT6]QQP94030.1 type IV secretion system protein [Skermanella sp. TT6]
MNPIDPTTLSPELIDQLASHFVEIINSLFGILPANFEIFYVALALVAFVLAVAKLMWLRSLQPVAEFFKFYVFLMVLLVVSENWNSAADTWVGWMSRQAYEATGLTASYLAPSVVLTEGFRIAGSLYESGISFYRIFLGSSDDSIAGLIMLISIGVFLWAIVQMVAVLVVTMIFYKISSLLALCLLPFVLLSSTRFAAAPGVVRVIQYGVQFWVVSLIIGLSFRFMSGIEFPERPTANEVLPFAIGVGVLATLMRHGMHLAREHIAGTPMLSLREGANTLQQASHSLNNTARTLMNSVRQHSREVGFGGGVGGATARTISSMTNRYRLQAPTPSTSKAVQNPSQPPQWAAKRSAASRRGRGKI